MTNKRVLFLSVSAGAGHVRAAEALRAYVSLNTPEVSVVHMDAMHFVSWCLRKLYVDLYIFLVKSAPALWGQVYRLTNRIKPDAALDKCRRWIERLNSKRFIKAILDFKPDVIVCTHFFPAEILSQLIADGLLHCPVWVQVTDFDLHRMWVQKNMTGYLVPNSEIAHLVHMHGVAPDAIHITGIPLMPAFTEAARRDVCAKDFDMNRTSITLLLMGGGAGIGQLSTAAEQLLNMQSDIQIIAVAGKNLSLLNELNLLAAQYPGRLKAVGYTNEIERLMHSADLAITKPGGLTVSECLAMGLPMIVISPVPGQEEHNANYLLEQGVALKAFDMHALKYRVHFLLTHPEKLHEMRANAKLLGRPTATGSVINTIMKGL
ncbi:MAG: glycosyltransferase [Oxalobacter sp.]|nr:MAG: glycosyltransferase [Oxalobacter sp.]